LEFVTGENSFQELPSWIPDFDAVPWSTPTVDSSYNFSNCTKTPKIELGETELIVSGSLVDRIEGHSSSFLVEDAAEKHPYTALNMASESFLDDLRSWIRFVQGASADTGQESKALFLFQLLLHPQILPFYESLGFQVYDHLAVRPGDRISEHRLFKHFCAWLNAVQSHNPILTSSSDHVLDQVEHFISCEWINTTDDVNNKKHTFGDRRAMLVIQRWVREFVARKRLFSTDAGLVGIAWKAARRGDLVVKVDGVRSLMVLREVHDEERYKVVGPCNIPLFRGGFTPMHEGKQRRFLLI
jgi:hypothetical protein